MLSPCPQNALNALVNRHLATPPNRAAMQLRIPFLTQSFKTNYQQAYVHYYENWRLGKSPGKLAAIERSHIYDDLQSGKAIAFVKKEVTVKLPKKARLIQGNHNERTAYSHPEEYMAVSDSLKQFGTQELFIEGVKFQLVYTAGINADALSDLVTTWIHDGVIFDERDGTNWDSTMQEAHVLAEASIYKFLGMDAAAEFLSRASGCSGKIKFFRRKVRYCVLKYYTVFKRLSGDWNTSVGNTLVSMCIIVTAILALPEHLRPRIVRGLFMGDDYLGFYTFDGPVDRVELAAAMTEYESKCGITPVRKIFDDPCRISFISMGLWPRRYGGWQFVPHPAKQLSKLYYSAKSVPEHRRASYCKSICVAMWKAYFGFEFMQRFFKAHYHRHVGKLTEVEARTYFNEYQVTNPFHIWRNAQVDWQQGFIRKYGRPLYCLANYSIIEPGAVYKHPFVDEMLIFETADPVDR